MSLLFAVGSTTTELSRAEIEAGLRSALEQLGPRRRVLAVPPDFTRMHSQSGMLTEMAYRYYGDALLDVLPALGTHKPMSDHEISTMFGDTPRDLFRVHDWRKRHCDAGRGAGRADA